MWPYLLFLYRLKRVISLSKNTQKIKLIKNSNLPLFSCDDFLKLFLGSNCFDFHYIYFPFWCIMNWWKKFQDFFNHGCVFERTWNSFAINQQHFEQNFVQDSNCFEPFSVCLFWHDQLLIFARKVGRGFKDVQIHDLFIILYRLLRNWNVEYIFQEFPSHITSLWINISSGKWMF